MKQSQDCGHLIAKVFRYPLIGNLENFTNRRIYITLLHLCKLYPFRYICRVWCDVYFLFGHSRASYQNKGSTPHFLYFINCLIRGWRVYFTPMKEQKIQTYLAPVVEILSVVAERGFFGSMLENPHLNSEQEW